MQDFDFAREFDKDKNIINGMLCSFFKEKNAIKQCSKTLRIQILNSFAFLQGTKSGM